MAPTVSVIIVTYNCADLVTRTLESLRDQTLEGIEVVVVDNASNDATVELVERRFPEARLIRLTTNVGFAAANNRGVAEATGENVFLLNPDAWLEPATLEILVRALEADRRLGIVGGTVRHVDGSVQEIGNRLDRTGFPVPRRDPVKGPVDRSAFFVGGCALLLRSGDWRRLGGFDERYFMFYEEVDLCWRAQLAGLDIGIVPEAVVWHVGGATLAGGYAQDGRHRTSAPRIYLRERNTLATVIKNGAPGTILCFAAGWAVNLMEALGFLALRQPRISLQYPRALWWNLVNLRETLRRRRDVQALRVRTDRELSGWARGSGKLRVLTAGGVPRVDD